MNKLKFISRQCALNVSIITGNPEVYPIISLWYKTFQKYNLPDFNFYLGKLNHKNKSPYGVMLFLSMFSPQ